MATLFRNTPLLAPQQPRLPSAPPEYGVQFQEQFSSALRLYFNQLQNFTQLLVSDGGGSLLQFPFVAASDNANQYATANNTPTVVQWSNADEITGFTLNVDNTATAQYSGIYKITYSAQFTNNDNAAHDAIVWLRINGDTTADDVPNSTTIFSIPARKGAGVPAFVCGYSEVVFSVNAGDSIGLWWGTPQAATSGGTLGVSIYSQAAQTTPMAYPATPSVIGSITFVSALFT
jgi:hypothetical protein